uniref:Uncharacterized protein n=1 Tax=Ananas comosus var. bracteatus TaxID=296719 RepID=A0A6V7PLK1_ANACO|nr:unnamed protein product [Ananas comosus var. bracteatus]
MVGMAALMGRRKSGSADMAALMGRRQGSGSLLEKQRRRRAVPNPGGGCDQEATVQPMPEVYDEASLREEVLAEEGKDSEEEDTLEAHEMGVSVWALSGEKQQDTIKVQGEVKGKTITILVDTGSTHSFIDFHTAKELKAQMIAAPSLAVTVAKGQKVLSKLQCPEFQWAMQGQDFQASLRVIRLEGSSIILGIDWLKTYGKVTFDFQQNSITMIKGGQTLVLKGISEEARLNLITAKQWY